MQARLTYGPMYTKALDVKSRSVEAVLSSETVDGHGEIVDQATWRLDRFLKNPVVLYQHSPYAVVGRAENVRLVDGSLQARIVFATTALADETFTLFCDGAMRAFSVGFRPGRIVEAQIGGRAVDRLLDCELFEVSAVSIPSNPDAVVKHKALGLFPKSAAAATRRLTHTSVFSIGAELTRQAREHTAGDTAKSQTLRQAFRATPRPASPTRPTAVKREGSAIVARAVAAARAAASSTTNDMNDEPPSAA